MTKKETNGLMQKIHPGMIGFDIDGVVADTAGAFLRIARKKYGINSLFLEDITKFEVEDCLVIERQVIDEIFTCLLDEPLDSGLQPMEDAMDVLHKFAEQAPLAFVTARPDKQPIALWLQHFLEPSVFNDMRLIAMGEHDNKAAYIKNMELQYFVDDRLQTCLALADEGITPLVFNQPWNQHGHGLQRVDNWLAIHALCFE
jgi:uncharacterized HAD superfamily protein